MTGPFRSQRGSAFEIDAIDTHDEAMLAAYAGFFKANGDDKDISHLRWLHEHNPAGRSYASVAFTDGAWAALYAASGVRLRVKGDVQLAVQSLDTLTDLRYRGHGLFPALAEDAYANAASEGVLGVYGFPNGSSGPVFFSKLGWREAEPVPFLIKPLRIRYFVNRLANLAKKRNAALPEPSERSETIPLQGHEAAIAAISASRTERYDLRAQRIWDEFAGNHIVGVERDQTYLNWRLVDKPNVSYARYQIGDKNEIGAWTAVTAARKHQGSIGYIMELLYRNGSAPAGLRLLKAACAVLRSAGCDAILAWCLPHSPNFKTYLRAGFLPFPRRLRPIELSFGVRGFDSSNHQDLTSKSRWYLSYLDSDTV